MMLQERFALGCRVLDKKIEYDSTSGSITESEYSVTELLEKMKGQFKKTEGQEEMDFPEHLNSEGTFCDYILKNMLASACLLP
eukprot:2825601-Pyramimonas_sp.AAC.1